MNGSILNDTKMAIGGITPEDKSFDAEIITHINTALLGASQIGIGPESGFMIHGADETWADLIGSTDVKLSAVKDYIADQVRLRFDTPQSQALIGCLERQLDRNEWRLCIAAES